ncbi:MAG: hypothetical protein IJF72_00850 [Clostridia bacterium]|nr:hypothetical protein [Clostridia bacterium]
MKKSTYQLALCGIMFAVIFVAMMLDRLLSLGLPTSTAVFVLLVVFCFCFIRNQWSTAFFAGLFFGVASFVKAIAFGEINNLNPLVSILPRMAVGIVAFAIYKFILFLMKNNQNLYLRQTVAITIGTFFGLVCNTVLYLTALGIYQQALGNEFQGLFQTIRIVLYTNILPEYLCAMILVPHVVIGCRRALHWGIEAKIKEIEQ